MFDNIEQLEKQVKSFQENILASSELLKGIDELIVALKAQQSSYQVSASELLTKMAAYSDGVKKSAEELSTDVAKTVQGIPFEVEKKNSLLINELRKCVEELENATREAVQKLSSDNCSQIYEAVCKISEAQKAYVYKLVELDDSIKKSSSELSIRYQDFLKRLESTNVDQLFKTCQGMKKSIEKRLFVLMVGVGFTAVLVAISLFVK